MCIHIYIYIHMRINIYAHVCTYIYVCVAAVLSMYVHEKIHPKMALYISVCVAAVLSIYIHEKRRPKMALALFNIKLHGAATRYAYANHANKRQVTRVNEACQKCESGVPRIRMSNVKRENQAELPARCAHAIA